jgi:small subunit ribosomal protein S20
MANTKQSTKRAKQEIKRHTRNKIVRTSTKTALKGAIEVLKASGTDKAQAKTAYMSAVKALSKAASKGALPKGRAARKISRLTRMTKKVKPEALASK